EIDWAALPPPAGTVAAAPVGAPVLRAEDLRKYYDVAGGGVFGGGAARVVKANEGVDFIAHEGETLAIVGESGCGKSTFAKVLMGLETATSGRIMLYDQDIESVPIEKRDARTVSGVQMVFQNPFDTLNPSMTVGRQIIRALEIFGHGASDAERHARMLELLDLVRLPRAFADLAAMPPERIMAPIDLGSHLLAFTPHSVVAAPYHRNQQGVRDAFAFFDGPLEAARSLLERRSVTLVVICPALPEMRGLADAAPDSFVRLYAKGELPDWLVDVSLPGAALKVYAVVPPPAAPP
ncbi:MAG TPA: ATP-binding cassette domain-containing protein, partial [Alphaproteobacteria bacterium]|nr:ATP-binding cassette domain-containing protein [Alphaproteobacteria bacterium]